MCNPPPGGCEGTKAEENGWWAPRPEDLGVEGEEGEYLLELLMREAPLEELNPVSKKVGQPAREEEALKGRTAPLKAEERKRKRREAPRGRTG